MIIYGNYFSIFKSNKEVLSAFSKVNPNIASSGMKCPKDKAINEAFHDHGSKVRWLHRHQIVSLAFRLIIIRESLSRIMQC